MAGYRQFHTKFWKDDWLIDLEPLERYLFAYLFTNELSSISGLYKLPLKVIVNETGLTQEFISITLSKFQAVEKIFYQDGVIWVVNMKNHHKNASPLTMKKVNNDVSEICDCAVKRAYLYHEKTGKYSIDTVSILSSESVSVSVNTNKDKTESKSETLPPLKNNYLLYEHEIGHITPSIADFIDLYEKEESPEWVHDAILETSAHGVNSMAYVKKILDTWRKEGRNSKSVPKGKLSNPEKNMEVAKKLIERLENEP